MISLERYVWARELYLDLLQDTLLGLVYQDPPLDPWNGTLRDAAGKVFKIEVGTVIPAGPIHMEAGTFNAAKRRNGLDWPATAHSMIGEKRMGNIRYCVEEILRDGVSGDFIETGVWRGGACIYMRGILDAHCVEDRKVFVADSFEGLPTPDPAYPADSRDWHHGMAVLAVSLEEVEENFRRYDLLDEQVVFLKGWFKDTLPKLAPEQKFSLVRLDGDMYGSTWDALIHLWPRLTPGGFLIIDDYTSVRGCHHAVNAFRDQHKIKTELIRIDPAAAYFRKE